ncbi:MAG: cation:proton antiporter [Cyanobacteria bacterium P01_E01_bin.45]
MNNPIVLLFTVFASAAISPVLSKRLRIPALVLLIGIGAIAGTYGLGWLERDAQLILMEKIGLLMIMLLAGLQTDLSDLGKVGPRALVFGLLTFGVPFAIGAGTGSVLGLGLFGAVLVGLLYSPHMLVSFPLVAEMGLAQTEVVAVAVGGTAVTTVVTLAGYAIVQAAATGSVDLMLWLRLLVLLPALAIACWIGLPYLGRVAFAPTDKGLLPLSIPTRVALVLAIVFAIACLTQLLGVDAIVGAFIAGLALNRSVPAAGSPVVSHLETIGNGLFIPAFLLSAGVLCNVRVFVTQPTSLLLGLAIVAGACGGKVVAAWLAGQWFGYDWPEVLVIAGLTLSRAALILVIVLFGQDAGLLDARLFNAAIVYVALTLLIGPVVTELGGNAKIRRREV